MILFISDLHLSCKEPNLAALFAQFIQQYAARSGALYILGDFFAAYLGLDQLNQHDLNICQSLKELAASGIKVYIMPGNRDFLMDQQLANLCGATLLPDPYLLQLPNIAYLLSHGDAYCTLDKPYMIYRNFSHHPWVKTLFLHLPAILRQKIANKLAQQSKQKNQQFSAKLDVHLPAISQALSKCQADGIIHGHTHRPVHETILINDEAKERIVLSDWGPQGQFLALTKNNGSYSVQSHYFSLNK